METLGNVVMADTVGFIRDLPHDLIAALCNSRRDQASRFIGSCCGWLILKGRI